ncbi:hypothetical protein BD626DRAFT_565588 [Schizophyllum amplum]|uniref:BTB domain-containing protein n=1 Tax=Schizophyllum amplum TaxID=97359 RepID=A0A550CNV8_9AGAR|nr:hypothetical protein BD626DRAFT_565588 [Auriculariopsis ampla]
MGDTNNHVEDLWFPDGNIIIRVGERVGAERVGERVCRVYKGFFATQSPVLADMLSTLQTNGRDTVGGIPVVTFPDEREDVLHWLKAMLVPGYFDMDRNRIDPDKLLAVLRLSHKYDVHALRRRSLEYLAGFLPVDYQDFQSKHYAHNVMSRLDNAPLDFYPPIYAIAREIGALWLIPGIIYKMQNIMSGKTSMLDAIHRLPMPLNASFVKRMDKVSRLITRCFPSSSFISIRQSCPRSPIDYYDEYDSDAEPSCGTQWYDLDFWLQRLHADPLRFYGRDGGAWAGGADMEEEEGMCDGCCKAMRARVERGCAKFWDELPKCLGLPAWKHLLAAKAKDLSNID